MDDFIGIRKLHEIDKASIKKLNINASDVKKRLTDYDWDKLSKIIGNRGNEVVKLIKELLS